MSTATIAEGQIVVVTGDTTNLLHGVEPGTMAKVKTVLESDNTAVITFGEDDKMRWVSMADLKVVEGEPEPTMTPAEPMVPKHELDRANERIEALRAREVSALGDLRSFKQAVTGAFADLVGEGELSKERANQSLDDLGCDRLTTKWTVTVEDTNTGNTVLTVNAVEADDEDAAIEEVQQNLYISATTVRVDFSLDYNGDGDVDFDDAYPVWDDLSDDADDYANLYRDSLSFTAEEEDD